MENSNNNTVIYFKKTDELCYQVYREVTQMIDLLTLNVATLRYNTRHLVASCIFIVLCMNFEVAYFTRSEMNAYQFDEEFYYNLINETDSPHRYLVEIYSSFLHQSFNFTFEDIIYTLTYCSKYMQFEFIYDLPMVMQSNPEAHENVSI
jgi:hypothetical protein